MSADQQVSSKPIEGATTTVTIEANPTGSKEMLPTIAEEGTEKKTKKPNPACAVLAKLKSLFSCVKLGKREKPPKGAKTGEEEDKKEDGDKSSVEGEKKEEEGDKKDAAEEKKKADAAEVKTESLAPTLPPVGGTAAAPAAGAAEN